MAITYETVKRLKEAGWEFSCTCRGTMLCIGPTLEELIEACWHNGRNFNLSYKVGKGWRAKSYYDREICTNAATPSEAVAALWLALNKKV